MTNNKAEKALRFDGGKVIIYINVYAIGSRYMEEQFTIFEGWSARFV